MANGIVVDPSHQLAMLNQKIDILTKEFNEVLNEIQVTTQGLAKMSSAALKVHGFQIMELQSAIRKLDPTVKFAGENADKPVEAATTAVAGDTNVPTPSTDSNS